MDRERVVETAIEFIRVEGLPGLTMRRLGHALGVEAMSLYRYVPDKKNLLNGIVETLVGRMRQDDEVLLAPRDGWQDFLQRLAHGVRRVALAEPRAFALVTSRPPETPWLRPPLRSPEWVESFLGGMISEGFSSAASVQAYRAFTSFLLGHLMLEVVDKKADIGPVETLEDESVHSGSERDFPLAHSLKKPLSQDLAAVEFQEALENLLDRIALLRTEDSGA